MAKDSKRLYMPMATGGLLRFPEEEKEAIKIKPKIMMWIVGIIVFLEIALKLLFR
jgi:preprotein translocase subunit Sec61beta